MAIKAKIKVIKKGEVHTTETPSPIEKSPKKAAKREIVATVSEWVTDFRERRRDDAKLAFEKLFQGQPQTSEM